MNDVDAWANAGGAWEPLATLLARVRRELGISPAQACARLRQGLETYNIRAEVIGWLWTIDDSSLVWSDSGNATRPSREGWTVIDWGAGTLADRSVHVVWANVVDCLKGLQPESVTTASEAWRVLAAEAQCKWILRPEVQAEAERRASGSSLAALARAYEMMAAPERNWKAKSLESAIRQAGCFPKKTRKNP